MHCNFEHLCAFCLYKPHLLLIWRFHGHPFNNQPSSFSPLASDAAYCNANGNFAFSIRRLGLGLPSPHLLLTLEH